MYLPEGVACEARGDDEWDPQVLLTQTTTWGRWGSSGGGGVVLGAEELFVEGRLTAIGVDGEDNSAVWEH